MGNDLGLGCDLLKGTFQFRLSFLSKKNGRGIGAIYAIARSFAVFFDTSHLDTAVASIRIQTHTYTTHTHTSYTPQVYNQTYNYT